MAFGQHGYGFELEAGAPQTIREQKLMRYITAIEQRIGNLENTLDTNFYNNGITRNILNQTKLSVDALLSIDWTEFTPGMAAQATWNKLKKD